MLLSKILPNLIDKDNIDVSKDIPVSGLAIDSRRYEIQGSPPGIGDRRELSRYGVCVVTMPCKRQRV